MAAVANAATPTVAAAIAVPVTTVASSTVAVPAITGRRRTSTGAKRPDSTSWAQELQRYRPDKRLAAFAISAPIAAGAAANTTAGASSSGGGSGGVIVPAGAGASSSSWTNTAPVPAAASNSGARAYRDPRHNKQQHEFKYNPLLQQYRDEKQESSMQATESRHRADALHKALTVSLKYESPHNVLTHTLKPHAVEPPAQPQKRQLKAVGDGNPFRATMELEERKAQQRAARGQSVHSLKTKVEMQKRSYDIVSNREKKQVVSLRNGVTWEPLNNPTADTAAAVATTTRPAEEEKRVAVEPSAPVAAPPAPAAVAAAVATAATTASASAVAAHSGPAYGKSKKKAQFDPNRPGAGERRRTVPAPSHGHAAPGTVVLPPNSIAAQSANTIDYKARDEARALRDAERTRNRMRTSTAERRATTARGFDIVNGGLPLGITNAAAIAAPTSLLPAVRPSSGTGTGVASLLSQPTAAAVTKPPTPPIRAPASTSTAASASTAPVAAPAPAAVSATAVATSGASSTGTSAPALPRRSSSKKLPHTVMLGPATTIILPTAVSAPAPTPTPTVSAASNSTAATIAAPKPVTATAAPVAAAPVVAAPAPAAPTSVAVVAPPAVVVAAVVDAVNKHAAATAAAAPAASASPAAPSNTAPDQPTAATNTNTAATATKSVPDYAHYVHRMRLATPDHLRTPKINRVPAQALAESRRTAPSQPAAGVAFKANDGILKAKQKPIGNLFKKLWEEA